jgi:EpsI family protein
VIRYDNRIPDDIVWRRVAEASRQVALPGGGTATVREITMRSADGRSRIVWYWYQVGDTTTANPVLVKLLEAWAKLLGDGRGSLLITLTADYQLSAAEVREQLTKFLANSGPRVTIASGEDA